MRRLVLAAVAATTLVCAPAAGAHRLTVPRGFMGVVAGQELVQRPDLEPSQAALMARSGVQTVGADFSWARIEPSAGVFSWEETDALVRAAAAHGLAVFPTVDGSPPWAARRHWKYDPTEVIEPKDPAQYAAFLTQLVQRYGPGGTFWRDNPSVAPHPIRAWEVWNEPEIPHYWRGPWLKPYVRLLHAAHTAIKRADPHARVVLAGLTFKSWKYLRLLYRAGARPYFDTVSLHPYTRDVGPYIRVRRHGRSVRRRGGVIEIVRRNRAVIRRYDRHRHVPIWVTELSWTSGLGHAKGATGQPSYLNFSERGQARRLAAGYLALARYHRRYGVTRVYWYSWMTADRDRIVPFDYSGLRRIRGGRVRSKPALAAYARIAHRLERR